MADTWANIRTRIRVGLLKDVPVVLNVPDTSTVFTDEQLLVAAQWAVVSLSQDQAQQASVNIQGDGTNYLFNLPDGVVDDIDKTGLVILHASSEAASDIEYLAPIRLIPGERWPITTPAETATSVRAFYTWAGKIVFTFIPDAGNLIEIKYWKEWDKPTGDQDILEFPSKLELPFAYLVAAIAFDPLGAQASAIRTWNRKTDSGTPEDNSLQKQSLYFLDMYTRALRRIGPQDRETYYNQAPRDTGFKR